MNVRRETHGHARLLIDELSLVPSATVLIDDPLSGLLVDLIPGAARLRQIFRGRLGAVAEQNHRLVERIRAS